MSSFPPCWVLGQLVHVESHAHEGSTGCLVLYLFPNFFKVKSLTFSSYTFHFLFKVLCWSVEFLGRVCKPFVLLSYSDLGATGLIFCWVWILIAWTSDWMGGPLPHVYLPHVFFYLLSSLPGTSAAHLPWDLNIPPTWGSWSLVSRGLVKKALCGRWKTRPSREPWRIWFL